MASTYCDDFVLNFDLNHLPNEENIQTLEQKYERLRKSTSWLKSRVISTDFAIQKYLSKTEDYNQAVKAHSASRDELKQACISYKDASEKCTVLENEKKQLLANQEVLQNKAMDSETKFNALMSHTNQLEMLVKELETAKEALTLEKELEKNNDAQKEKKAMLSDIMALIDVVLGKKKKCKRHVTLLKKYGKDMKCTVSKVYTSEESDEEIDAYCNPSSRTKRKLNKINKHVNENVISNSEQSFLDQYSDSSNGEVSVDTGRGSSRANSHDKYLSSPDHLLIPEPLKVPQKYANKLIDAANSPITIYPSISVATSPIIFDDSELLFEEDPLIEDQYGDSIEYSECFDGTEYIIHEIPMCEDISIIQDKEYVDACTSPVSMSPDFCKSVETGTSANENVTDVTYEGTINISPIKSLFIDPEEFNASDKDSINVAKPIPRCLCQKDVILMTKDKEVVDACTSPVPKTHDLREFVDKGTNTTDTLKSLYLDENRREFRKVENETSRYFCDKSTCTDTHPVSSADSKLVHMETTPLHNSESVMGVGQEILHQGPTINIEQISRCSTGTKISNCGNAKSRTNQTKEVKSREKVCLESNSSINLCYENINDDEVQNILNVMKLHHDLISPIPKTPCEQQIHHVDELGYKITQLCSVLGQAVKMTRTLEKYIPMHRQLNEQDALLELENINSNVEQQPTASNRNPIEIVNISDSMNTAKTSNIDINTTSNDYAHFKKPSIPNGTKTKDVTPGGKVDETNVAIDEETNKEKSNSQPQLTTSDSESSDVFEHDIISIMNPDSTDTNTSKLTEKYSGTPVAKIFKVTKTNKKTKLQKFRNKLFPSGKIKKITPITKRLSKACNLIPKDISSPSLNQKIAYEKAVKVMAEQRSNQARSVKPTTNPQLERVNQIKSSSKRDAHGCKKVSTRSRTRSISKKEEDITLTPSKLILFEENTRDIQKSDLKRKVSKRPADTDDERLQSNCKRILRSSSISQVANKKKLICNDVNAEILHTDGRARNDEREEHLENVTVMLSENDHCTSMDYECSNLDSKNRQDVELNRNIITDNAHVVLETKSLTKMQRIASAFLNPDGSKDKGLKVMYKLQEDESTPLMEIVNHNVNLNDDHRILYHISTVPHKSSLDTLHENSANFTNGVQSDKSNDTKHSEETISSSKINRNELHLEILGQNQRMRKQRLQGQNNQLTSIKQNAAKSLELKLIEEATTIGKRNPVVEIYPLKSDVLNNHKNNIISYSDLELYTNEPHVEDKIQDRPSTVSQNRKENILCDALDRYGVITVKYVAKKVPDSITLTISQKIEDITANIIESPNPNRQKSKMDELVKGLQNYKTKYILSGLMKYLKDPTRKNELFNKINNGAAPPMTKSEMILLYVIEHLNKLLPSDNFINRLWNNIEHALFQLNRTPDFDVIESMSHFYAVMCRYFRNKSRLRCFMLDAMYCLQFKAVPLIRQCLDVCPAVLPYAHEHMAKTSLVTCLVYLLHFYKCQDKYNRAQEIRNILYRKYSYRFSEWNETMILAIFRKAIMDLRGTHNEKKMLRVALIILCKRHGAKWCETNIIKNILLPIIEKQDVPERIKQFCVLMLGPLLKPFPADRKAQCEIVMNQLLQMLKQHPSHEMKEAIYSSLIFMNKHDQERVVQALLSWNPEKISPEFKDILNDYVMEKPLVVWKKLVTRNPNQCT